MDQNYESNEKDTIEEQTEKNDIESDSISDKEDIFPIETEDEKKVEDDPESAPIKENNALTETEKKEDVEESSKEAEKPQYYLLFGGEKVPDGLDLEGTLGFLNEQLKYDGGELRKARNTKDGSAIVEIDDESAERCSYCGVPITGVDYYRLLDGRRRGTGCSRSLVTSLDELKKIIKTVLNNLEVFFNASIDVPINVEMIEERKLKKKIKKGLDVSSPNVVILGVAIEKDKKYTIYIENSAPRASVVATFAHELTHIWQYTHWDRKKLKQKYGKKKMLEVYEGMAKWTEIQYLFNVGENTMAKHEKEVTERRDDEYGKGFVMFEDRYPLSSKTISFAETPFTNKNDPLE